MKALLQTESEARLKMMVYQRTLKHRQAARLVRRGVVATEFALTGPLLILLALAAADFGRVSACRIAVLNAARTASELGAGNQFTAGTRADWDARVEAAAREEMQNVQGFDAALLSVDSSTSLDADDLVWVEVEVAYTFHTIIAWPGLPSATPLRSRVRYRQFR